MRLYVRYSLTRQSLEGLYEVFDDDAKIILSDPEPRSEAECTMRSLQRQAEAAAAAKRRTRESDEAPILTARELKPGYWAI